MGCKFIFKRVFFVASLCLAGLFGVSYFSSNNSKSNDPIMTEAKESDHDYSGLKHFWFYEACDWAGKFEFDGNVGSGQSYKIWRNKSSGDSSNCYYGKAYLKSESASYTQNCGSEIYGSRLVKIYYDPTVTYKIELHNGAGAASDQDYLDINVADIPTSINEPVFVLARYHYTINPFATKTKQTGTEDGFNPWISYDDLLTTWVRPIYVSVDKTSTNSNWTSLKSNPNNLWVWSQTSLADHDKSMNDREYSAYQLVNRPNTVTFDGNTYVEVLIPRDVAIQGENSKYYTKLKKIQIRTTYNGDGAKKSDDVSHDDLASASPLPLVKVFAINSGTQTVNTANFEFDIHYYDQGGGAVSGDAVGNHPTKYTYTDSFEFGTRNNKTGYTFAGYYSTINCEPGSEVTGITATDGGDKTLYAKWSPNTYTVNLDRGPATTGSTSITATYDTSMPSTTMPEEYSYEFQGYYDAANGSGTKYYNADGTSARTWNKTTDNTTLYAYWKRQPGFYVIDYTGGSYGDINTAVRQDDVTVGENNASWTDVVLTGGHDYRLVYLEADQTLTPQYHDFLGNYTNIGITHLLGYEDGFSVTNTGEYKIFYTSEWKTYINRDFTITCKAVIGSVVTQVGQVTCNSDNNLNAALGSTYVAYDVKGYYSNEECTTSINIGTYCPSSDMTLYAKCESQPTIANNKVRIWIGYDTGNPFYKDGGEIKLWIHSTSSGGSELVYSERNGTYNNTQEGGRRYDFFDVDLSCYTNGWYLTVQRFVNGSWQGQTDSLQLSATNVGMVYYVWGNWSQGQTQGTIGPGGVGSCDVLMAVWAMNGLHTCSTSVYNGYGAFNNFNSTFVKDGDDWKIVGSLSANTVLDFNDGDTSYSGSATKVVNAYSKYQWLNYYANGGEKPAYALGSFGLLGHMNDGNNTATIIIIIASSVSLLSITVLSILLIKKRKSKEQ